MRTPKDEYFPEVRMMSRAKIVLAHIAPIAIVLALLAFA